MTVLPSSNILTFITFASYINGPWKQRTRSFAVYVSFEEFVLAVAVAPAVRVEEDAAAGLGKANPGPEIEEAVLLVAIPWIP